MGKVSEFVIELDAEKDTSCFYVAGQAINGFIKVVVSKPLEIRRIYVQLEGKAEVKWTETHGKTIVRYHKKEVFFVYRQDVFGTETGKVTLTPGQHQFPFSYALPTDSASSFQTDHGKVRYKVEAIIDKPWAFDEHTRQNVPVTGILDLNAPDYYEFVNPITVDMSADASGLLSSGKVHARISLSRRCVVPGDTVFLSADIHNESNRKIEKVWASMKQYIVYHAQKKKRQSKRLITITKAELIAPGAIGHWVNAPLVVPQMPPTNLAGRCTILIVNYALKFYTDTGLKLSFPIVVGTIPLRGAFNVDNFQSNFSPITQNFAAPPSYEEANRRPYDTSFEEGKSNKF